MSLFLKILAWFCKIAAILFWGLEATVKIGFDVVNLREAAGQWADADLGASGFFRQTSLEIILLLALLLLAVLPNRWLIFSKAAFAVSVLIALIPFYPLFSSLTQWSDLLWMLPLIAFFSLVPVSLAISFWRRHRGEKVGYV